MRPVLIRLLTMTAALAMGWAAAIWWTGGFTFSLFGARFLSYSIWRPLLLGIAAGGIALWWAGPGAVRVAVSGAVGSITADRVAVVLAVLTTAIGLRFNTWTASGPDPFAYVSQAALLRSGRLDVPVPLAKDAPWPNATATFAPLGYRVAPNGAPALVPMTAAGVPMIMAALQLIAGHWAAFVVTPIAGGALVLLTFAIGRRVRSPATGLVAAWLVATSPAVLFMVMWPMTDVPAAALTALMVWLLLHRSNRAALWAGLAAGGGVLTRMSFAAMAAGAGAWLVIEYFAWHEPRSRWRVAAFTIGLLPAALVTGWLNARWYGSPLSSGYGAAGALWSASRVLTNTVRYARWLAETSPLALVGLATAAVVIVTSRFSRDGRREFALMGLVVVTAWIPYLLYESFADWWYLRFLLPAWPAMFVAAAVGIDHVRAAGRTAAVLAVTMVIIAGVWGVMTANARGVFSFGERRYASIARLVQQKTEPTAVILTVQHSGTIRYYAGRDTLRWDQLDRAWLDRAVDWLSSQGRHPYLLIEDWEEPSFEARFSSGNNLGRLSFSPVVAWQSNRADGWVYLFDPLHRDAATWQPGPEFERAEPFSANPASSTWPN